MKPKKKTKTAILVVLCAAIVLCGGIVAVWAYVTTEAADVNSRYPAEKIVHTIEIDIARLYPMQRVVLDNKVDWRAGDTVMYDITFGIETYGVMAAFVRCKDTPPAGPNLKAMWRGSAEAATDRFYQNWTAVANENELYFLLHNRHPENSGVVIENITGTVTITRAN